MTVRRAGLGLAGSLILHAAAGLALLHWVAPRPVPQPAPNPGRILLATMEVPRARAAPRTPESPDVASGATAGARMAGQGVPLRRADALAATGALQSGHAPVGASVADIDPSAVPRGAVAPTGARVGSVVPAGAPQGAVSEAAGVIGPVGLPFERQVARPVESGRLTALAGAGQAVREAPPVHRVQAAAVPEVPGAVGRPLLSDRIAEARPPATRVGVTMPQTVPAQAKTPDAGEAATGATAGHRMAARLPEADAPAVQDTAGAVLQAGLAWSGEGSVALDSQSLATIQAFLAPGQPAGRDVRDRMARAMEAPDCARVHTVFDAETGTLEVRGHVPEAQARAPLIAALRDQIGGALELRDALRILPRPQCALLDAFAGLGLPPSEEQLTDPDLVGENTQVREYAFSEGDRLRIDLTAPDYPAHVYVDYFDASGQVLHLMPNDATPLRRFAPGEVFAVGGGAGLDLRIAPPFGQDIAVAFAASAPLPGGARPMVEQAGPYLMDLRDRIAEARAADPGFRGEWVYLFVATSATGR